MATACLATRPPDHDRHREVTKGYYLVQQVNAYNVSAFGALSTATEADKLGAELKRRLVSGIEFGLLYFDP
jgi:hypothetical protein